MVSAHLYGSSGRAESTLSRWVEEFQGWNQGRQFPQATRRKKMLSTYFSWSDLILQHRFKSWKTRLEAYRMHRDASLTRCISKRQRCIHELTCFFGSSAIPVPDKSLFWWISLCHFFWSMNEKVKTQCTQQGHISPIELAFSRIRLGNLEISWGGGQLPRKTWRKEKLSHNFSEADLIL